jgi:chemotaxis protein CheD
MREGMPDGLQTSKVTITVGMADMKASTMPDGILITHALGSCLGITIYDPEQHVGGMLHAMLPESSIDPAKGIENPFMFIDTGVPRLFHECYRLGAQKPNLVVKVAGGASNRAVPESDYFRIGERNFVALRKLLWRNNVLIKAHDVGGCQSRTMSLDLATGQILLRVNGKVKPL